jgi:sugar/nucleoside kinase (ribokinase family)
VKRPVDVVVCGHLCLDLFPQMEHVSLNALASPGRLYEVGTASISTGGAVSNTGLALHRLGAIVRLMASVGDDVFGRGILDLIEQHDPSLTRFITVQKEQPSSYTIVLAPEKVDRIFLYGAGANTSFSSYTMNYGVLDQAKILHLGYPTTLPRLYENDGEDLVRLMRLAKVRGVITSLDTTLPDPQSGSGRVNWQSILRRTLPHTDIFIPSIEEIVFMLRRHDYDRWGGIVLPHITRSYLIELANEILDMGAAVAGFKLGGLGVFIKTAILGRIEVLTSIGANHKQWADITEYHPAFDVDVVGTTGAGDAAYAGFLLAMIRGLSPFESLRWACAVGACCVEAIDATSGIKSWHEISARLESGWKAVEKRID